MDYSWICQNDTYGSDHFPIIIYSNKSYSSFSQLAQFWKINKADWSKFTELCENTLNSTTNNNIITIDQFVDTLISIANDTIPKTHSKMKNLKKKLWFNDDYKKLSPNGKKCFATYENNLPHTMWNSSAYTEPQLVS